MVSTLNVHELILLRSESAVIPMKGSQRAHTSTPTGVVGWLCGEAESQNY
jgi:hypothetical protein